MIRVNLLKNKVGDAPTLTQMSSGGGGGTSGGGLAGPDLRETLFKLLFMAIGVVGLMIFESQNIRQLQAELTQVQVQASELEQQAAAKTKELEGVKDVENQARELEDKLKILKRLSKLRLREVKTLDFIQSSIPEKVWLKNMNYEADKEQFERGRFAFTGNSVATEDLTEFVKRLEESAYLFEVIVMKNQEVATQAQKGVIRDFQFTAQVEVKQ